MIARTIGVLGLIASMMAFSSLIYGACQEPLYPYMQGVMGGVMDVYRTMRDGVFVGLDWAFSGLINWVGRWVGWLPPAPWFRLGPIQSDFFAIYLLGAGATYRAWSKDGYPYVFFINFLKTIGVSLLWPFTFFSQLWTVIFAMETAREKEKERDPLLWDSALDVFESGSKRLARNWVGSFFAVISGSTVFFVLVYAENRIGL